MVDEPDAEGEYAEPVDDPIVDRPDAADAGPLMAYSATRLESGRCLFSWWAKYLAKLPEYHHPVLGMGSFQHRVIERYVQKCVEAKTEGEGLFATQALDETWAENPSIPLGTWHDTFAAVHWFAQNYRVPWDHVVGAELEWAVTQDWTPCTWHDPGVRRRGRVDLLEVYGAEAIVVDWKCLTAEQGVTRGDGSVVRADDLMPGDEMLAWDPQRQIAVVDKIASVRPGGVQPCVRVSTRYGRELRVSANHPLLTERGWIEAAELESGDVLQTLSVAPSTDVLDEDEARLLGYFVGDGGTTGHKRTITTACVEVADDVAAICRRRGYTCVIERTASKAATYRIGAVGDFLRQVAPELIGIPSRAKRVPQAVFRSSPRIVAAFVAAYFDCDGYVQAKKRTDVAQVTASRGLAVDLQELFARLGIAMGVWRQLRRYRGREYECWWVKTGSLETIRRIAAALALRHPERRRRLEDLGNRQQTRYEKPPRPEAVVAVEPLGELATIAVTMETYGTFVASALVTHNTGRAVASQREVERAWAPRMYGLLALAHNPSLRSVRVIFHYTRYGYRRAVHFELADLARAREEIERAEARFDTLLVNREDASLWPALPGTYCGICGHQSICPQKDAVAALGPISTPDQAVDVARRILYREVALARDREALREWTDATGTVRAGGAVFDHWPMPKWEANVAAVLAACRTHGVPVDQVVRADKKQIEKIGKVAVAFREEALAAFKDVGKTTFKWKREAEP